MLEFKTKFSEVEKFNLGFELASVNKAYMPVPLKVSFSKEMFGYEPHEEKIIFTPDEFKQKECYVMAAVDFTGERALFIRRNDKEDAYAFDPYMGYISLVFEAEKFLYIMENASKRNKLIMFRNAVIPSIQEANMFLALVDASTAISIKDRNRAWTWIQQKVKGRNI